VGNGEGQGSQSAAPAPSAQRGSRHRAGWRLLSTTLRRQRRGLILGILVGLLYALSKILVPKLTQLAIDHGVVQQEGSLLMWSLLIVAVGLVVAATTGLRRLLAFRESRWTETTLREQLFEQIMRLHVGYHDRSQAGGLMSRASSDLLQIQAFVVMIPLTISSLVVVCGSIVILLTLDPVLTVFAVAPLPLINWLARRFSSRIHPAVMAVQQEQAQLAAVVEESVAGIRVVKGFGAEPVQAAKLAVEAEDIRRVSLEAATIRSRYLPAIDVVPNIGLILVLLIGGHRAISGDLTIGQLLAFNLYLALMIWPLRALGMTVAFGQRAGVALTRVQEVLGHEIEVADPSDPVPLPDGGGAVTFRDVTFGYGTNPPVLEHFDLDIAAGSSIALVGATGSGKSTVARLMTRFYDVRDGAISIDGVDIRDVRLHELRAAVSIVFEDTFLFHDSVAANIAFAVPDASPERIERAARLAGAHDFIVTLPDGYATVLGERGYSLSGGQRQRIAIARAIAADPRVLILDDATSAVDPTKEHEIRGALRTVMHGRTTIVIAHRPATISLADQVVLLDGGRVLATGRHDELLRTSARYRQVLAAWAEHDELEGQDEGAAGTSHGDLDEAAVA
jgi:ATP-binding cassette subfamily B protein